MELVYIVVAFVAGFVLAAARKPISAWLARRAEANKLVTAQKVVDAAKAAEKVVADAKALLAAQMPTPPANPKP